MAKKTAVDKFVQVVRTRPGLNVEELAAALDVTRNRINNIAFLARKAGHTIEIRKGKYYLAASMETTQPAPVTVVDVPAPVQVPAPAPVPTSTAAEAFDSLVDALATRLAEEIIGRVEQRLVARMTELSARIPEQAAQAAAPGPKKKRVIVIGLLNGQADHIHKEFSECFDIRFHGSGEPDHKLRDAAKFADHVLLMTDFIGHHKQTILRNMHIQPIFITGGLTKVRETLTALYVE